MRVVAVVGRIGVGKTTLAELLLPHLGWAYLSIDAIRGSGRGWPSLINRVQALRVPALVESVLLPDPYRRALARHDSGLLIVTCAEQVRLERLRQRAMDLDSDYTPDPYDSPDSRTADMTCGPPPLDGLLAWARHTDDQ